MASNDMFSPTYMAPAHPRRWLGLLLFFGPYLALVAAAMLWFSRTPPEQMGGAGMGLTYAALVFGPVVPIYLVLLPLLVRGLRQLSSGALRAFALRASLLSIAAVPLALGGYLLLSPRFPSLADRYFVICIPILPPLLGVLGSYFWTVRRHPRKAVAAAVVYRRPSTSTLP